MKQFKPIGFVKMKKTFVFLLAFPNIDPILQFSEMSCQFSLHNFLPLLPFVGARWSEFLGSKHSPECLAKPLKKFNSERLHQKGNL